MIRNSKNLISWWDSLSSAWKKVIIQNLELDDCFSTNDLEYIFTITELDCRASRIEDLQPLYYLTQLESLDISETYIQDLSPIRSLPYLKEFNAVFFPGMDLSVLLGLKQLRQLDISYPQEPVKHLEALKEMHYLRRFFGNSCGLESTHSLTEMVEAEVLCLHFNQIPSEEVRQLQAQFPDCKVMF